jgi:hypothetical protein
LLGHLGVLYYKQSNYQCLWDADHYRKEFKVELHSQREMLKNVEKEMKEFKHLSSLEVRIFTIFLSVTTLPFWSVCFFSVCLKMNLRDWKSNIFQMGNSFP